MTISHSVWFNLIFITIDDVLIYNSIQMLGYIKSTSTNCTQRSSIIR